jgi:hypothetical protein
MNKRYFYRIWQRFRHSIWYPAILGLIPSFVVSFSASFGQRDTFWGLVANFVATEGLVVLVLIVARPALDAHRVLDKPGFLEIDTPDSKILLGRLKAEIPEDENFGDWDHQFNKVRDSWLDLLRATEKILCADQLSLEQMRNIEGVFRLASGQVRAGAPGEIYTLKRAACYLGKESAKTVTQVLVINRIKPALWFTPSMSIYTLDIYRHVIAHPNKPKVIRISIVDNDEFEHIQSPTWRISNDIDPLKAFIAINQMSNVELRIISENAFSKLIENFLETHRERIRKMCSLDDDSEKDFIRDVAFIMYCDGESPLKAFRGRPYHLTKCNEENEDGTISFFGIDGLEERKLHYDLFQVLLGQSHSVPLIGLAQEEW